MLGFIKMKNALPLDSKWPGFKSQPFNFLAMWVSERCLAEPVFSFLIKGNNDLHLEGKLGGLVR